MGYHHHHHHHHHTDRFPPVLSSSPPPLPERPDNHSRQAQINFSTAIAHQCSPPSTSSLQGCSRQMRNNEKEMFDSCRESALGCQSPKQLQGIGPASAQKMCVAFPGQRHLAPYSPNRGSATAHARSATAYQTRCLEHSPAKFQRPPSSCAPTPSCLHFCAQRNVFVIVFVDPHFGCHLRASLFS